MLIKTNTFDLHLLTYWQIWLCGLLSFGHHIFIILAHQKSKTILPILMIGFLKIFITWFSGYVLFGITLKFAMLISTICIICCAVIMEKDINVLRLIKCGK
jgi:hypothetical protein